MTKKTIFWAVIVAAVVAAQDCRAERLIGRVSDDLTRQECGACHMPYQGRLHKSQSWDRIMKNLENHFGEDASLDAESRDHILGYLLDNAMDRPFFSDVPSSMEPGAAETPLRVTEYDWFKSEHGGGRMTGPTPIGHCDSCHFNAAGGIFEK